MAVLNNLGWWPAGSILIGEFNLVDGTGAPASATTPTLGVFHTGSATYDVGIGIVTPQVVGSYTGRYTYTFTVPSAGIYIVSFLAGSSVTGGVNLAGQNVAMFISGWQPVNIVQIDSLTGLQSATVTTGALAAIASAIWYATAETGAAGTAINQGGSGTLTARQIMQICAAMLGSTNTHAGETTEYFPSPVNASAPRITSSVDTNGNRIITLALD